MKLKKKKGSYLYEVPLTIRELILLQQNASRNHHVAFKWIAIFLLLCLAGGGIAFYYSCCRKLVLVGAQNSAPNVHHDAETADTWVLARSEHAPWIVELLKIYGKLDVAVVDSNRGLQTVDESVRIVILQNAKVSDQIRRALQHFVKRGGVLVELGPNSAVCDTQPVAMRKESNWRVSSKKGRSCRWPLSEVAVSGENREAHTSSQSSSHNPDKQLFVSATRKTGSAQDAENISVPLVTTTTIGRGICYRWMSDFAEAIQRYRQGDWEVANIDVDQNGTVQPSDLFYGRLQKGDYECPAADVIGFELLAQLASAGGPDVFISPLPGRASTVLVLTGDQDYVPQEVVLVQSGDVVDNGFTFMLTDASIGGKADVYFPGKPGRLLSREAAELLGERMHELGIHPNLLTVNRDRYNEIYNKFVLAFTEQFGVRPYLVRNHHLLWEGYVDMAKRQARLGFQMNLDYVSQAILPGGDLGYMTGSGMPGKLVDENGEVISIYQVATQLDDHPLLPSEFGYQSMTIDELKERSKQIIDTAMRYHTPVVVNHHPHWWYKTRGEWIHFLTAYAKKHHIPVWGAGQLLQFTRARRETVSIREENGYKVWSSYPGLAILIERSCTKSPLVVNGRKHNSLPLVTFPGGEKYEQVVLEDMGWSKIEWNANCK